MYTMEKLKLFPVKIFFILSIVIQHSDAQSWTRVESLPPIWLTAIAEDGNKLWVAGLNKLYYTQNQTSDWDSTDIIHPDLVYISDIIFHEGAIFVTDEFKGIYRSDDQGNTWQDYNQGLSFTHLIGGAIRGDSLYIGTIGEGIFVRNLKDNSSWKAFSAGVRWRNTESITNISGTLVAGVGSNATMYINKEQENSWNEIQFSIFNGSPSALLAVTEADNEWIAAGNYGLYTSSDKGQNWTQLDLQTGFIGQARLIYQDGIIYAHLAKAVTSKLYFSSDNGNTWNIFSPTLNAGIEFIFWNEQLWYATQNGLWKLENSTKVDEADVFVSSLRAYPNPFTHDLNVEIEIIKAGQYKIEILSVSGTQSFIIQDKWMESGTQFLNWNSNEILSPGTYILRVSKGASVKSTKIFKSE
jgi:photosystem II stability/assembly factor-like uncharacterized protein